MNKKTEREEKGWKIKKETERKMKRRNMERKK